MSTLSGVSEDRLLAALASLELNLSRQITNDIRSLESKLAEKVGKSEFETLRTLVQEIRDHGSTQAVAALKRTESLEAEHRALEDTVSSWRNRFAGALLVLGPLGVVNGVKLWFGFH